MNQFYADKQIVKNVHARIIRCNYLQHVLQGELYVCITVPASPSCPMLFN